MELLSVTASVITVLQATEAVVSICCDYRSSVKDSSWEVPRVLEEIRGLRNVLRILEELADKAETPGSTDQSRLPALKSLCDPDTGILSNCYAELERLKTKVTPPGWSGPAGSKKRGLVEALSWPLKKGDTEEVLVSIERFKSTISLAVAADQTTSVLAIEGTTQHIKTSLTSMRIDAHQQEVRKWLRATDPSPKYIKALQDRLAGTGSWFTNNKSFSKWIRDPNSLLWLHGIPGCGKTVLCSTAIERVLDHCNTAVEGAMAVGYFYFEFCDQEKQRCDPMLRSLIAQLSLQGRKASKSLDALYSDCGSGGSQPSLPMLLNALRNILESFTKVFILVEALDECKERDELATNIEEMAGWEIAGLHMLVTSRRERDIEESLSTLLDDKHKICIQSALVEDDIRAYVRSRIRTERKLKKWQKPEVQAEIMTVLVGKAGGMFQWVKCQLDALGRCLCLSDLREALRSLPKDLDDTYSRILQSIDDDGYGERVAKIMQWLAYSTRPMSLTEFAEVITVDVEGDPRVDVERRLGDPQDLLKMCSSLVSTVHRPGRWGQYTHPGDEKWEDTLQFAHFSVREYLGSPRLFAGSFKKYAINEIRANAFIAEACIVYLLQFDQLQTSFRKPLNTEFRQRYPLADYAASNWPRHAKNAGESGNIVSLCKEFLLSEGCSLPTWLKLLGRSLGELVNTQGRRLPIFCALLFDLPNCISEVILNGADVNSRIQVGGRTPLMEVVSDQHSEHVEVVQLLLDHGAEVNTRHNRGGTALISASYSGHLKTVRILLDNGADIDAQNREGETALIAALLRRHAKVVQLLLDRDPSIGSPYGENALGCSTYVGDYESAKILLDRGANVNAELGPGFVKRKLDGQFGIVLLQALHWGHNDIVKLLLEYGADVNARSTVREDRGVVLEEALNYGSDNMVQFLLENGADSSLVMPENLVERGKKRYEGFFSKIESQSQSLRVQEEEAEEP